MRVCIALLAAFAPLASAQRPAILGGWKPSRPTDDNKELLSKALSGDNYSKSVGDTRVCYSEVKSVETQVVAGTNYLFTILGCDVRKSKGACSQKTLKSCQVEEFEVKIFDQPWTKTLEVMSITKINDDSTPNPDQDDNKETSSSDVESAGQQSEEKVRGTVEAAALSEDEKKAIDVWIQANGLNKYGDDAMKMYTGGTPLFDESTGMTKDRFDYILSRHPTRPWQRRVEALTLSAVEAVETSGLDSVVGKFAIVGVLTVMFVGFVMFKRHQRRRDYTPVEV